jgi:hypothetical protein
MVNSSGVVRRVWTKGLSVAIEGLASGRSRATSLVWVCGLVNLPSKRLGALPAINALVFSQASRQSCASSCHCLVAVNDEFAVRVATPVPTPETTTLYVST